MWSLKGWGKMERAKEDGKRRKRSKRTKEDRKKVRRIGVNVRGCEKKGKMGKSRLRQEIGGKILEGKKRTGKDGTRWRKMEEDRNGREKMGKDGRKGKKGAKNAKTSGKKM